MNDFKIPKCTEQVIPQRENLFKALFLIGILFSSFFLTQAVVNVIDTYLLAIPGSFHFVWKWEFICIMAVLNAVVIMGLGILGHEGTHRVLFKNKFWNELGGADTQEPMENHPFWFIMTGGILFGGYAQYRTVMTNLLSQSWEQRSRGLKDVFFVSIGVAFYFYLVPLAKISLWYTVIPTFMIGFPLVVSLRNYTDHGGLPPQFRNINQKENFKVDSWIILTNPLINWIWSNINYHQVHHRYPYLSHRYLKQVFEATKDEQPYIVVKGYFQSLINSSRWKYYGNYEDLKPFLTTRTAAKS